MTEEIEQTGEDSARARTSKRMAWLLDECFRFPFTKIRFGFDPLVGILPGAGEFIATFAGATVLWESGKKGIPFRTLFKMGGNMLLNALLGLVPLIGDIFSVWFKSNKRNYELLNDFLDSNDGEEPRGGWWPIAFAGTIIMMIILVNLAVVGALAYGAQWFYTNSGLFPAAGS